MLSTQQSQTESKDPSQNLKTALNELLGLASSEDKDWEKNVVEFLEKNRMITKIPEKGYHIHMGMQHPSPLEYDPFEDPNFIPKSPETPSCANPVFHLWVRAITHPKLSSAMKLIFFFHNIINEAYFPLKFHSEKTLQNLISSYENEITAFFKDPETKICPQKACEQNLEREMFKAAHNLMVIYRHNFRTDKLTNEGRAYIQQENQRLKTSVIGLLSLVNKEMLMGNQWRVDEGDWGNERMCTLKRAIETEDRDIVHAVLAKGYVTHNGIPSHTGDWAKDCIFQTMYQLDCSDDRSKDLCCLIAQFDTGPDLVTSLPDDINSRVKQTLTDARDAKEAKNSKNKFINAIDQGTGERIPKDIIVGLISSYVYPGSFFFFNAYDPGLASNNLNQTTSAMKTPN